MFFAKALRFYKHKHIQSAIIRESQDKEVGVKFDEAGFGKRPEVLNYESDILDFAQKRATSFHLSEELWTNVLALKPGMQKRELDLLRKGWDFILDIDCEDWELSRIIAYTFIEVLKSKNIKNIGCKFSGNKGFHIAIPFEAFPKEIDNKQLKDLFPELPKAMASFLLKFVEKNLVKVEGDNLVFSNNISFPLEEIFKKLKLNREDLIFLRCIECDRIIPEGKLNIFICKSCNNQIKSSQDYMRCHICNSFMERFEGGRECVCGETNYTPKVNLTKILNIDTLLLSSRHMYRAPYSLHEKSGLVSLPMLLDEVLTFDKEKAKPEKVVENKILPLFINRNVVKDDCDLFVKEAIEFMDREETKKKDTTHSTITEEISEEYFPPCIKKILLGLKDGRKRSLFILINFLRTCGWGRKSIETLIHNWNEKNFEKLRENIVVSQVNYHTSRKDIVPPPNCRQHYQELGVCFPEELCNTITNPVMYAIRKHRLNKRIKKQAVKDISELWKDRIIEEKFEVRNKEGEKLKGILVTPLKQKKNYSHYLFIFCHGFYGRKENNQKLARLLAAKGFNTAIFDFSGYGESEGEFGMSGYLKQSNDLTNVIDYFNDKFSKIVVIGHSMGGGVALNVAKENKAITGLIIMAGAIKPELFLEKVFYKEDVERVLKEEEGEIRFLEKYKAKFNKSFFEELDIVKPLEYVEKIDFPVLILVGERDDSVFEEQAKELYKKLKGKKKIRVIKKAGHNFRSDEEVKKVFKEIFLWWKEELSDEMQQVQK